MLLLKLQALACNFTKSNIPTWVFFKVFRLHIWYQIAQRTTYALKKILEKLFGCIFLVACIVQKVSKRVGVAPLDNKLYLNNDVGCLA